MSSILDNSYQFRKMTNQLTESEIVKDRLREICPDEIIENLDDDELKLSCVVAFKIIGYEENDLDNAFKSAKDKSEATRLSDFIYDVWRLDE